MDPYFDAEEADYNNNNFFSSNSSYSDTQPIFYQNLQLDDTERENPDSYQFSYPNDDDDTKGASQSNKISQENEDTVIVDVAHSTENQEAGNNATAAKTSKTSTTSQIASQRITNASPVKPGQPSNYAFASPTTSKYYSLLVAPSATHPTTNPSNNLPSTSSAKQPASTSALPSGSSASAIPSASATPHSNNVIDTLLITTNRGRLVSGHSTEVLNKGSGTSRGGGESGVPKGSEVKQPNQRQPPSSPPPASPSPQQNHTNVQPSTPNPQTGSNPTQGTGGSSSPSQQQEANSGPSNKGNSTNPQEQQKRQIIYCPPIKIPDEHVIFKKLNQFRSREGT